MANEFTTAELKASLRRGPYTFPGGYGVVYLCSDGGTLHHACVRENYREVYQATRDSDNSGWRVVAEFANWEDPSLYCDHCNERIESEYAEEDCSRRACTATDGCRACGANPGELCK